MYRAFGIVGLEFGAEFIPIYQRHANAEMSPLCQRTESKLDKVGDKYGIDVRYTDYDAMLADPNIDVIHINTPLPLHADQVVRALEGGKHVGAPFLWPHRWRTASASSMRRSVPV